MTENGINFGFVIRSIIRQAIAEGDWWIEVSPDDIERGMLPWIVADEEVRFNGGVFYKEKWDKRAFHRIGDALLPIHRGLNGSMTDTQRILGDIRHTPNDMLDIYLPTYSNLILFEYINENYDSMTEYKLESYVDPKVVQWLWTFPDYYAAVA